CLIQVHSGRQACPIPRATTIGRSAGVPGESYNGTQKHGLGTVRGSAHQANRSATTVGCVGRRRDFFLKMLRTRLVSRIPEPGTTSSNPTASDMARPVALFEIHRQVFL